MSIYLDEFWTVTHVFHACENSMEFPHVYSPGYCCFVKFVRCQRCPGGVFMHYGDHLKCLYGPGYFKVHITTNHATVFSTNWFKKNVPVLLDLL